MGQLTGVSAASQMPPHSIASSLPPTAGFNGKKQIDTSKGSAIPPKLPQPFSFMVGVGEVIPGWDRTLKQMRVGETRQVVVPPSLGYGEKGIGPIPGGAPLYFEVTLLELKPMKEMSEKQQQWLATHPEP